MSLPRSSLARLALVILTIAVGLSSLKANSAFWVGVMTAVTAYWLLVALVGSYSGRGRARVFWTAFLTASTASLVVSFGPWSDRVERAGALSWSVDSHKSKLSPISYSLAKLMDVIEPDFQGTIDVRVRGTDNYITGSYRIGPATRGQGITTFLQEISQAVSLQVSRNSRGKAVSSVSAGYVAMPDYQDAGHLLAALNFGLLAGLASAAIAYFLRGTARIGRGSRFRRDAAAAPAARTADCG